MPGVSRAIHPVLPLLLCVCASGCANKPVVTKPFNPEPMAAVVEKINRNNQDVQTVWAKHYYEATIRDTQTGKEHFINGDGVLFYKRPSGFRLIGNKFGPAFEVGGNDQYYWFKLTPNSTDKTMWYGEQKNIGRPCVQSIPIQPNLVMEVLGVGMIDPNFVKPPAPVMRYNPDNKCYMFVWVTPGGGSGDGPARLIAQREIWYDQETLLPRQVMLFDSNGKVLLRALLDKHKPVGESGGKIATTYSLFFPDSRSKMWIEINDLRPENKGIPTNRGIAFPGALPADADVNKVIKLDADCTD